jgi:RNA polymerase sigma-70 factor (ECF subfamily)
MDAAAQIFERFGRRLLALARGRLGRLLRGKVDPEDVLQSVFQSFFRRQRGGRFDLKDWDNLWTMLAIITIRKCGRQVEHFQARRRDVRKEISPVGDGLALPWEALAREPTPLEAAVFQDTLEHRMRGLEEPDREILRLQPLLVRRTIIYLRQARLEQVG